MKQERARYRVGIVGFGYIARQLYELVSGSAGQTHGLEAAFVWTRRKEDMADVAAVHQLHELGAFAETRPSLIVEAAHPQITRRYASSFLACADYMPLSVSAFIDDDLTATLRDTARQNGTRVLLPRGALVGGTSLAASRHMWQEVTITFRKHPDNIDFSESGIDPLSIRREQTVFKGPVREIARLFPRNVNTMVTCAMTTIGLDRCIGHLIADPDLDCAIAEVEATGIDGSVLRTVKHQPVVGVSGTEMFDSLLRSLKTAVGALDPIDIV